MAKKNDKKNLIWLIGMALIGFVTLGLIGAVVLPIAYHYGSKEANKVKKMTKKQQKEYNKKEFKTLIYGILIIAVCFIILMLLTS